MTGDVSLNPNSTAVVMTTEILRNMIYRSSELMREVAWVVFDEVHYMQVIHHMVIGFCSSHSTGRYYRD